MTFTPSWKKYEEAMRHPDSKRQGVATDKFIAEREHAVKTDSEARRWEEGRKKELARNKPQWIKEQQEKEVAPIKQAEKKFKNVGTFEYGLRPTPGYLIIEPSIEEKTSGGIILSNQQTNNTGIVLEVGEKLYCKHCFTSIETQPTEAPAKKGDKILFKMGAGIEMKLKDKNCKFMMFSDVLGIFI